MPAEEPLVDVFDEGDHLRIDVQFKNIPWPEDIIGELEGISFKHGVLELKPRKRGWGKLTDKEIRTLEATEEGEIAFKVRKKLMRLEKRWRLKPPSKRS